MQGVQLRSTHLLQALTPCFCLCLWRLFLREEVFKEITLWEAARARSWAWSRALTRAGEAEEPSAPGGRLDVALTTEQTLWTASDPSAWSRGGLLTGDYSGRRPAMAIPPSHNPGRPSVPHAPVTSREQLQHATLSKASQGTLRTCPISSVPLTTWHKMKSDLKFLFTCLNTAGFNPGLRVMLVIAFDSPDFHLQDKKGHVLQPLSLFHSS